MFKLTAVFTSVVLFSLCMNASAKRFQLDIQEKGTVFKENVEVDERKKLAVFKIPAHNDLGKVEQMNDFVKHLTISRVYRSKTCYVSKLTPEFKSPERLKKSLELVSKGAPSHSVVTISRQWVPVGPYPRNLLRKEARMFCGDFPVVHLREFTPDSFSVEEYLNVTGRNRRHGQLQSRAVAYSTFSRWVSCNEINNKTINFHNCLHDPCLWSLQCRLRARKCVYLATCNIVDAPENKVPLSNDERTIECSSEHAYNTVLCCDLVCGKTKRSNCKDN